MHLRFGISNVTIVQATHKRRVLAAILAARRHVSWLIKFADRLQTLPVQWTFERARKYKAVALHNGAAMHRNRENVASLITEYF